MTHTAPKIVLGYGIVAGLIVAVPMVALMLTLTAETAPDNGALFGYLTMIVALTAVFLGVKHYRDKVLGGAVKFDTNPLDRIVVRAPVDDGDPAVVGLGQAVARLFDLEAEVPRIAGVCLAESKRGHGSSPRKLRYAI